MVRMPVAPASGSRQRSMRQLQQMRRGSVRNLFDSSEDRLARQMEKLQQKSSRRLVVDKSSASASASHCSSSGELEPEESETSGSFVAAPRMDRRQMFAMSRQRSLALPEPVEEESGESQTSLLLNSNKGPVKNHCRRPAGTRTMLRNKSSMSMSNSSSYSSSLRDLSGIAGLPPLKGIPDLEVSSDLDDSEFTLGEELASFRSVLSETIAELEESLSEHNDVDGIGIHFRSRARLASSRRQDNDLRGSKRSEQPSFGVSPQSVKKKKASGSRHKRAIGRRLNERNAGDALFRIDPRDKELAPGKPPVARLSINPIKVPLEFISKKLKEVNNQ